jgi:drug/metabolite transporter superfamily protein YnfA
MSKWSTAKELLRFLRREKKWWLLPLAVVLLAMAALILFAQGSSLAPFLYPFF